MRAAKPKQYLKLRGRAVLEHSVNPLMDAAWIDGVVIVLAPGDDDFARLALGRHWGLRLQGDYFMVQSDGDMVGDPRAAIGVSYRLGRLPEAVQAASRSHGH